MTTQNAKSRQRTRRRREKLGSVLRILSGPELNTSPCGLAQERHLPAVKDMIATLRATEQGVGLAAPQIGCDARIFIMRDPQLASPVVFINPEFTARSIEMKTDPEGCLSEPGKFVPIERHLAVWLKYYDQTGERRDKAFLGFPARIIQHEMDHLDGFCKVLTNNGDSPQPTPTIAGDCKFSCPLYLPSSHSGRPVCGFDNKEITENKCHTTKTKGDGGDG